MQLTVTGSIRMLLISCACSKMVLFPSHVGVDADCGIGTRMLRLGTLTVLFFLCGSARFLRLGVGHCYSSML